VVPVTCRVPPARGPSAALDRVCDPERSRGIPLSEPTIRVVKSAERSTDTPQTPGLLGEAPAVDHTAAE
jgi:hypothetical protein